MIYQLSDEIKNNSQKKKKRKLTFLIISFFFVIICFFLLFNSFFFLNNDYFLFNEIKIKQNYRYSSKKLIFDLIQVKPNEKSIFKISLPKIRTQILEGFSYKNLIKDLEIKRVYPNKLKFIFNFKEPLAHYKELSYSGFTSYLLIEGGDLIIRPNKFYTKKFLPIIKTTKPYQEEMIKKYFNKEEKTNKFKQLAKLLSIYRKNYENTLIMKKSFFSEFFTIQSIDFNHSNTISIRVSRNPALYIIGTAVDLIIRLNKAELDLKKATIMIYENLSQKRPKPITKTINPTLKHAYFN